jgi:hypothetical protein
MESFKLLFANFNDLDVQNEFQRIATSLMNEYVLIANKSKYRLAEIEFYMYEKGKHEDTFIHANVLDDKKPNIAKILQSKMAKWYYHYSGIDITFGNIEENGSRFGGILLRGLIEVGGEPTPDLIGPLKIKNTLLNQYSGIDDTCNFLKIVEYKDLTFSKPIACVRFGLGKTGEELYKNELYRFILPEVKSLVKGCNK